MLPNNSVFVWKTSSCNRGRANLRNYMNQVKNLKSLGFTCQTIANLLDVFHEVVLCDIDFCGFVDVVLIPIFLQSSILWQTVLQNQYYLYLLLKQMIHQHQPKKFTAFTSPLSTSCTGKESSQFLRFFIHQPFCHVCQVYKLLAALSYLRHSHCSYFKINAQANGCHYGFRELAA